MGFHKQAQFAKVIDVETCHLINNPMQKVFDAIKKHCHSSGLPVYDQKTHL
jgi:tRNA/tmRNA/rRNA uracil-C5-methylase (TrmA/RlmC/RlmD family)